MSDFPSISPPPPPPRPPSLATGFPAPVATAWVERGNRHDTRQLRARFKAMTHQRDARCGIRGGSLFHAKALRLLRPAKHFQCGCGRPGAGAKWVLPLTIAAPQQPEICTTKHVGRTVLWLRALARINTHQDSQPASGVVEVFRCSFLFDLGSIAFVCVAPGIY